MTTRRLLARVTLASAWGGCIVAGALWLKLARPESRHAWLAVLMGSEPVHVAAHLVLYGALALLVRMAVGRREIVVFACVLLAGVAQETAQVIHVRSFGRGEAFDLFVDAVAALVVLGAIRLVERRRRARARLDQNA